MFSLDVDSLFINMPLAIAIYTNTLFENTEKSERFIKNRILRTFYLFLQKNSILFNGKLYKQVDIVDVGSALGPALANSFLLYFEKYWLQNCPSDFKPHYYRRYVDVFVLFTTPEHLETFQNFLNGPHANI